MGENNPFEIFLAAVRQVVREELNAALDQRETRDKKLETKAWLRAAELAELYNLPQTWFEERGREGSIQRAKPGRYVLFSRKDVEAYFERSKNHKPDGH